ncbi:hypothetical protein D9758_008181 [Tetrapyrgos nigripes]|uniref:Fatty acid desaturase domain-containing protein n=1 Tax=Tetrapyrgos nigripes TaxID=182062 RepID=A0A8H5GHM9_9AGAR|nr:hypothetical protein D9758_008181 [Tetrapyrgos nigripes]
MDLRAAVPKHLFKRSTTKSLFYILQHLVITMGTKINDFVEFVMERIVSFLGSGELAEVFVGKVVSTVMWLLYWGWQGMAFAGIWCLGHEAGHDGLSEYRWFNHLSGILLHTFVLTPFYSWRTTHRSHHKATNNMERDETYMPPTRKDFKLPDGKIAVKMDYQEVLEETPGFTLFKLFVRQFFHNRKGNRRYPPYTSVSTRYIPPVFRISGLEVVVRPLPPLISALQTRRKKKYYHVEYSDYQYVGSSGFIRKTQWKEGIRGALFNALAVPTQLKEWTFSRGALATVDRPLFGWVGRVLLHNISTDHVAHHFFASVPFYNLPEVTEAIKPVLGEYYNYDSTITGFDPLEYLCM